MIQHITIGDIIKPGKNWQQTLHSYLLLITELLPPPPMKQICSTIFSDLIFTCKGTVSPCGYNTGKRNTHNSKCYHWTCINWQGYGTKSVLNP